MYRMVSFETQSELGTTQFFEDPEMKQRTQSGLTQFNFSRNQNPNPSTDSCFNFSNINRKNENKYENMRRYTNENDINRVSNVANICNEDAYVRNSVNTRISGINQINQNKKSRVFNFFNNFFTRE